MEKSKDPRDCEDGGIFIIWALLNEKGTVDPRGKQGLNDLETKSYLLS